MSGERASVPSASDVGLPQLDEEDLGAHRDQRNSGADVARERAPWRDQRDEERGTPDERQQLRGELVAPPRPHHAEADRRRHEQDHGVVHGRESSWSDYFGPNDPLGGNNPSDPQPSYEWTKGHCPYCHGWHDPDDCTKREDKLERTASTYAHYHRMTGRPCTCPWGYRHKRRLAAVHTAGQHYNKLLKTPDKRLNTPEGDRFKELLGQQLERVPEADPLTPWLAQRFKRGDIRHTASSDVNALGYSPWDNFSAYRDDPVSSPLRDDQLRYWSDWYNARQHPTRRGVNVMHPDFGVHQMRQKVAEHQQALSEQRLLDGGLNDPGNRIVQRWPDGWHVTQLGSDEAMEAEGQAMNHCVGSDEQPYKNLASTGDISVYSLRDPRGWPHGTWHTNNNQGGVAEVFGHSDRSLAPQHQEKYEEWAHDNDFDPTPVGHQEHAEDAAIQMPAADDVRSYYDLHGNGDETEYIPHDANYGENTELLHQEPDYYSITDDLYRNRPGVGYVYDAENHRYRGVTPEETREHTFDTADMNGHLPALHSEMMDYQPTGAAEEEVQKHWRQMARTYNNDDLNEPLPLPDVQHTYQFPQPTAPPTPPGQLQFGQPTARTADWNTIRDEGYEAPRWLSDEWDVDDPAQTFKGMPLYWGDHGDCPRCLGAGCAACSQGMVPWPSPNEPRTSEWHLSSKLDWLRGREDLQTPEGRGWLTYLERQHPQADPLYPWLTREWKKGRLYRNAENIYHHAYDVTDPSGRQYSLALDSPTVRHWMDWYNSDHPTRQGVDIGSKKFTVADMHGKIGEWNDDMERRAQEAERQQQNDAPILHQWPDGWTVRNLTKPEHLNYEGESMGHCVGGYCSDVTHGNTAITSLRDPSGVPHATAEFEPTQYDHRFTPQDLEHGLGTSVAAGFDEGLKNQLRDYHANGTWDPAAYQAPEHYADVSALHQQLEDSYGRRIPRLENSRIVQIQGRGNEVPKPEYQQRMKDWFATFPEATRPNWGYDSAINHIGEITNDPTHLPPDDDWDDGGYGPHGDYGLVEPKQPTNYDNVLRSLVRKPMRWQGYSPNYAPEDVRALYDHARKRDEIPHLAQATGDYQRDVASPAFDDHLDNNLDYYPSYPGESLEDDFGHWSEPDPNSYGQDDRTPHERFQDAREDYDEGQQEAIGNVPEMGIVNDIYGYLQPHWNEATSSYENAFPQSKGTFSRVGHSRELHVGLDVPKRIKNQIRKWVDGQDWPAGVELEPISEYHITLLYARDGYDEHDEWVRHTDGYEMTVKGIAQFGDDAIVLTLDSPDAAEHNKDLVDMADNRDLDVSKFPGGYKPHLTIAYGKLPDGLKPPKLKFKTGPSSVSEPREAAWHFADDGPIPSWGQLLNQSETERDSSQGFANGWEGDVYHGTTPEKREQILAQGFDPQAQAWARSHGRGSLFFAHTPEGARYGPAMIKAHVKLNKPMTFWWDPNLPSKFPDIQPEPGGMVSDPPEAVSANWGTGELAELAKRTGHDGAIYPRRDEMQVFDPSAIVSAEPYDPDAKQSKTAANQTMYHVAPQSARESIMQHGIDYTKGQSGTNYDAVGQWQGQQQVPANYLWSDSEQARYTRDTNTENTGQPFDLWEVNHEGIGLQPDPYWAGLPRRRNQRPYGTAHYTTEPIPPERLRLLNERQSKTAMAERSGIPELDRAIDEFMQSEFKSLETTVTDLNEYREPHNAHGQCEVVADALAEFLKERGFKAYATSDELSAFPGYEDAQLNEESYPDHAMVEVYGLPGMGVNTVTIDFTASQYGFVEFPKIEGGKLGKTAAQPTTMYHVSPGRNHQSIMSRGLFPPGQGGVKGETEALAPGIYLYHNYDYALQDSYERFEEDEQPRIYAVNVDGLSLQGDPTWNDPKTNEPMASYSTEPILPERLRLLNERQNKTAAYPDETEYGNREFWQPNDTAHYEYHCHRGHDSADAALWYRSHQPVTVLHRHPSDLDSEPLMEEWGEPVENPTAKDRMEAGMPYGYQVRWPDGHEGTAMEDELFTHPRHFDPNGGPPPVQEVAQHDPQYAQWLTQRQSKTAARPYYRWLPTAIRDDVQQSGMSPNPATGNPMHFWDNLENAQRYGEIANLVEPHDLWQVQGRPGRLKLDPWFKSMPYMYPEYGSRPGAWQSDAEHIEPERLQLWTDPSAKMSSWRFAAPLGEDFFNSVMQGEQAPGTTLSPQDLSADPEAQRFRALQQSYRGPFDAHIETSIPDYARNTMDKGAALARAFPGQRLLDIGSSTGAFGKALSQLGMQTTNLDPSREMTQHFQQTPSTLFDEHAQQSFGEGYTDNEGDWIEPFKPGQPYDIVHQSMAFQFIGPEREQQINHAKSMMHPGGIFLIEEKVRTANEDAHEAVKDQWKSQFYSPDQLADKQEQIGFQPTSGMTDQLVHQDDLEQILQQHFASVVQYWSSGNFKGYAASDNPNNLAQFLQHYRGQSNPQFAAEQTPRMLGDGEAGSMPQQPATSHLYTRGSASNLSQPDNWLDDRTSSMERTTMDSMDSSTDGTDNPINCTDNSRDSTDNRTDNPIQPSPHRDPHTHTSQHTTHTSPVTDSTVTIDTTLTDSTVTAHWAQRYSTARSTPALRPQRSEHTSQHTKGVRHVSYMGTQNGLDHPLSQFSPKSSELAHTASRGGSPSLGVPEDSPYRTSSDGPDYQDERYGGPSYKEGDRVLYKAQYDKPQLGSVRDIVRWPSGRFHGYLVMLDGNNAVTAQDHQLEPENGQAEAFFNHPDPWMDNEPGTTTFPQQWNHLGATKVAWETEPEMSDWDEEIPLNFHDPEQPIDSIESTPGEYYHVAPAEERARIMTHGLLPSKTWQDNYADEVEPRGQAQGIYMWDHPEAAQRWANSQQKAADIWRVTLPPNHPVARDQILGTIGAHYTPSAVPPQQLEWMGPSETAMKDVPEGHPWGNPKPNWRDPNDDWPMDDLRVWRPQETLSQPPYNIGQGIPKRLPLKPSKLSMERGVFYHVAPRSVRQQILTEGLRGHEPDVESPWEDNDTAWGGQNPTWRDRQPRGNYFFDHPDQAKGYIARLHGKSPEFSFEESGLEPDPDDYGSLEDYEHAYDEYAAKPITDNDVHQLAPEHQGWDIWKTHLDPDRQRILSDPENSLVAEHYDNEQTANPSTWEALHEFRQQSQEGDYDPDIMRWYTPDHVSPDQLQHYSWTPHWGVSHDPEEWGDYNQTEVPDQFTRIPMQRYFGKLARPVPDDYWYDQTEKRPYVYHATDPYNLPSIFEHGVVPWDHQGVEPGTNYTDQFVPRPGHVYLSQHPQIAYDLADSSMAGKGSNRHPVVLKIRRGQLDPQNINPDEDDLASQYHEFEDLLADNKLPADHSLQNGGWSRGTAAEAIGFGSDPRDSQRYLNNSATFAHRGPIPPQAIESVLQGPPMPGVGFGLHESQPYGFGYTSAVSPQLWQLAVEALWGGNSLATAQDAQRAAWGLWERGMGMGLPVSLEDAQNALKLAEMAMHHSVGQGGRPYEDDTAAWHPGEDLQEAIAGEPPTWLNEAPTGRELPGPQRFGTTEGAALAPQGSPLLRASSIA